MIKQLFSALIIALFTASVQAQNLKLMLGFPPGGGVDLIARAVEQSLSQQNINVTLIYKPGASGIIALNECEQDLSVVCLVSNAQTVSSMSLPDSSRKFKYDELGYLKLLSFAPNVYVTRPSNLLTYSEIIKNIQNDKVSFAVATAGLGHNTTAFLRELKPKNTVQVEYKGAGPAALDILGGHVDYALLPLSVAKTQNLKIVFGNKKYNVPELKGLPTVETNFPNVTYQADSYYGFVVGSKMSEADKNKLLSIIGHLFTDKTFEAKLESYGMFLVDPKLNSEYYKKFTAEERLKLNNFLSTQK